MHKSEVLYHRNVLVFSEIENASLLLINPRHHPSLVSNIVMDLFGSISSSRYHHESVLKVFCEDVLIGVALEHDVEVLQLVVLCLGAALGGLNEM